MSTIDRALSRAGQPFVIYRSGRRVGEALGLKDGKQRSIMCRHDVAVLVGDWLEDTKAKTRLFVTDVDHASSHIRVLYETRLEYERHESAAQVIAMLDDIAEAVWKLSDEKMPKEKKQRAQKAVKELQAVMKSLPPGVAGGLAGEIASRFLDSG